jgi:K+-sensing histidine kinase KdpD
LFPQNTVDLIKTFAAQSVLAIQNVRLFHEIEEKGRELEVASQHKSQFLANMSHELRTPLNAIIGYSEILQEDVADLGQDTLVPDLKKIEGAGRHLLGLINDILDLSKIEAGKMDICLEDIELVPLLEEVRAPPGDGRLGSDQMHQVRQRNPHVSVIGLSARTMSADIRSFIPQLSPQECANYFRHAGYVSVYRNPL